jgi:hypothetical protein
MGVGSPGYYVEINLRQEVEESRRHITNALQKSGVGKENPPLTELQKERLEEAYDELGKVLQTLKKYPLIKRKRKK